MFGCSQEDNSVSLSYKAISIKWGKVSRGDYIAYAYDDGSYEIKSASNQKVAKGTYSYYTDDMDRITIKICETEYLDLDNNTMKSMSSIFSVAMNNNNSEFSYSCGNGLYIWFMLESVYNLTYN